MKEEYEEQAKIMIKSVLYDITVYELATNNVDEINTLIRAITYKLDDYENIVEAVFAETLDNLDYDRIKDVCYDLIF